MEDTVETGNHEMCCPHLVPICINPHELIRKYRCGDCVEVFMCECDEDFALKFLPHQINKGTELETRLEVPVTSGFLEAICNKCRGLPLVSHPRAELMGSTTKIDRYYWRELYFETTRRFADWSKDAGYDDIQDAKFDHPYIHKEIAKSVRDEMKELHRTSPLYVYHEVSQEQVIAEHNIEVLALKATYVKSSNRRAQVKDETGVCDVDEYVSRYFRRQGYEVIPTESIPFHVLFGIYMWILIQYPTDSLLQLSGFGDRFVFEDGGEPKTIMTLLPRDFGTPGYAKRRSNDIEEHIQSLRRDDLGGIFDYWLGSSCDFRQYLWAHRSRDIETARKLISILPQSVILDILRYLVGAYWQRYLGWPDLLVHDKHSFFFVEVKSSKDRLSQDQKDWIKGNATYMNLPFKIVKVHKSATVSFNEG